MLKYNIKVVKDMSEMTEIKYESLYLSPDMSYISGVTSCDYNLVNGQNILLYANDHDGYQKYTIEVKKIQRRGYVKYLQTFDILTNEYDERYITYVDGQSYIITNNKVYIDQMWHDILSGASECSITVKYYVENGYVTIYNTAYEVDFDYEQPYIVLRDGTELLVQNYNKVVDSNIIPNITYVTHFTIRKSLDYKVEVTDVCCAKNYPYIIYQTEMIDGISYQTNAYLTYNSDNTVTASWLDFNKEIQNVTGISYGIDKVIISDTTYTIYDEWRNVKTSSNLHLYLDSSDYYFEGGQVIKVTTRVAQNASFNVIKDNNDNNYVNVNGVRYHVYNDLVYVKLSDNAEKRLYRMNDNNEYYFIDNDKTCVGRIVDGKFKLHLNYREGSNDFTYDIIQYNYIVIDNVLYKFLYNENKVVINTPLNIFLIVEQVTRGNMLRCIVYGDDDSTDFIQNIVNNPSDYIFELYNPLFDEKQIQPMDFYSRQNFSIAYKIYNPTKYVTIPLTFGSEIGVNLQQENIVQDKFVNKEMRSRTNPIIDMEKDIYYPVYEYQEDDKTKHALIDKIVIDLHFLARDLDTWKIKENAEYNILETYNIDTIKKFEYYQPSDLLCFLNFTNNDVFYQKTKIKKTFLRLSFYDSIDPMHQSLLHTSTVFLNEGHLYAKYTENMESDYTYKSIDSINDSTSNIMLNNIGVNHETVDENGNVTMDENGRLSCQFTIQNRYESKESSEGFYLYIFKEFSQGLHPSDIYMKVEFNHAGEGKTINFMQPYKVDGGQKRMLDLSDDGDIGILSSGVSLTELYEHLYIPFKAVYDDNLKKYVYHAENWLNEYNNDKSIMKLNLYEVNFKNES